jgi:hypothetical protein
MNVVCLVGRLVEASEPSPEKDQGGLLLRVPRRGPGGGGEEPGVVDVALTLSPGLNSTAAEHLQAGRLVAVMGMLDVDVDYSSAHPSAHPVVIAERFEALA